jgi:hypothetical protein
MTAALFLSSSPSSFSETRSLFGWLEEGESKKNTNN